MSWNNGYERRKFEEEQKRLADEYRKVGMSEAAIRELYIYDLEVYNKQRAFYERTQPIHVTSLDDNDTEGYSSLNGKFMYNMTESIESSSLKSRYWWIDEIDSPELSDKLKKLSLRDIELLTEIVFDGSTQKEIGIKRGVTQQAIADNLKRIKRMLQNISSEK